MSPEVAKHAIGFSSLGAYITHLKLENEQAREELGSKVDRVECSTDEILKLVKNINSCIDPKSVVECFNKISSIYETLQTSIVRDAAYTKPQQAAMMEELKKLAGFLSGMRKIFGQG